MCGNTFTGPRWTDEGVRVQISQHFKANQGTRTMGRSKLLFVQVQLVFHFSSRKTKRRSTKNLFNHCTFERRGEGVPLCRNEIRLDKTFIHFQQGRLISKFHCVITTIGLSYWFGSQTGTKTNHRIYQMQRPHKKNLSSAWF